MRPELELALAAARTIAPEALPRLLGDLEEVRTTALARLSAPISQCVPDVLLDVNGAAERLGVSAGYLYRNHRCFPFVRRMGRNLRFSSVGIEEYIRHRSTLTPKRHSARVLTVR
jgi:predicted DNA-binding transcriptional regulator AlpA